MSPAQFSKKYARVANSIEGVMRESSDQIFGLYVNTFPTIARDAIVAKMGIGLASENSGMIQAYIDSFVAENQFPFLRFMLLSPTKADNAASTAGITPEEITADDVRKWVETGHASNSKDNTEGKVFDQRDGNVAEVVRRMQGILIFDRKSSGPQRAAKDKYLPFISQFVANERSIAAADWISEHGGSIVLAAWVQYVRATWPGIARRNLKRLLETN